MHESCQRAFHPFSHAPGIVRIRITLPPHLAERRPSAWFERFLDHPVTRIGAAAAVAPIAEVGLTVFLFEVITKNIEWRFRRMVLTNPEIPVGLDVEEQLAGQASPVVSLAAVIVIATILVDFGI